VICVTDNITPPGGATAADSPAWKAHGTSGHAVYEELAASDDFAQLRRRYRAFVLPYTLAFLAWYLLYVLMSNWADGFMDTKIVGHINVALVFGLLQFVSTFAIAVIYSRFASRRLDPLAGNLRRRYDDEVTR
jgi:uncharacterized membrane protein (DUF485 family)